MEPLTSTAYIHNTPDEKNRDYLVIPKSYDVFSEEVIQLIHSIQNCPVTLFQLCELLNHPANESWYIPLYNPTFKSYARFIYEITPTNSIFRFGNCGETSPLIFPVIHMKSVTNLLGANIPRQSFEVTLHIYYALYRKILYKSFNKLPNQTISPLCYSISLNMIVNIVNKKLPTKEEKFEFLNTDEQTMFTIMDSVTASTILTNSIIMRG